MSCGVGCRHGLDLAWLWLWCRPAATAPIRHLAWEPPYATGAALKRQKKPQKHLFLLFCPHQDESKIYSLYLAVTSLKSFLNFSTSSDPHIFFFLATPWKFPGPGIKPMHHSSDQAKIPYFRFFLDADLL